MKSRVFLVEDHEVVRDSFVMLIDSTEEFEICGTAANAEDALPAVKNNNIDLLMVDLSLPGMSGIELVKQIRQTGNEVPVLVLTGHDKDMYRDAAFEAGANSYVTKGSGPEPMLEAMSEALRLS